MLKGGIISSAILLLCLSGNAQLERNGTVVTERGDTLSGIFRYEEGRLFAGLEYLGPEGEEEASFYPADTLLSFRSEGRFYRSLSLRKEQAGMKARSLALERIDGKMDLYEGRYPYRSCTCQERPSIREGAFLRKEEEGRVHLVKKNRFLDRIENPEAISSAFLPFEKLMRDVRDRAYAFSELDRAVERYNERAKALSEP